MKKINKLLSALILVVLVAFASCNKDKDEVIINEKDYSKVMEDFQVKINDMTLPSSLGKSEDVNAQRLNVQFNFLKGFATVFSNYFNVPENAERAETTVLSKGTSVVGSKKYTWSDGINSIVYIVSEKSDRYTFTYSIKSPEFNGVLMSGYSKKDGSYAELNMYGKDGVTMSLKWTLSEANYTLEITSSDLIMKLDYSLNNKSGNLKIYNSGSLASEYFWNADGSGTFKDYKSGKTFTWTAS